MFASVWNITPARKIPCQRYCNILLVQIKILISIISMFCNQADGDFKVFLIHCAPFRAWSVFIYISFTVASFWKQHATKLIVTNSKRIFTHVMLYNHCMQINWNLYYWRSSLLNRLSSRTTHRIYQHRHEYHGNLKKTVTFARLRQTWPHSRSVTSQELYLIWSPFKNPFESLIRCILVPHKMLYTILVILLYKSEIKVSNERI